jgi:hypothetical protein
MIKIFSNHGLEGGSTESFINLTNELNNLGYNTLFITPHEYPLDKCNSLQATYDERLIDKDDSVIVHYIDLKYKPKCKRLILSCHEQQTFPLNNINYYLYDNIHFVSEHQAKWQNINRNYFINGNIYDNLIVSPPLNSKIGGVVGQIYPQKNTLESIIWALKDECEEVFVYGKTEDEHYEHNINTSLFLLSLGKVKFCGFKTNKQAMYDSFTDLYFCSENECLPTVVAEATLTGKNIHIPDDRNYKNCKYEFNKNKVIETWLKELQV